MKESKFEEAVADTVEAFNATHELQLFSLFGKMKDCDEDYLMLTLHGVAVGFLLAYAYEDAPEVMYLSSFYIREDKRKLGYGTVMINAAIDIASKLKSESLMLLVKESSWIKDWYKKLGFEEFKAEGDKETLHGELDKIWMT